MLRRYLTYFVGSVGDHGRAQSLAHGRGLMPVIFLTAAVFAATVSAPAYAFDRKDTPESGEQSEASGGGSIAKRAIRTITTLQFGFSAYKNGDKDEAFKAYRDAADQGHIGARWKLANMYASGDGVHEDDYEAFKLFRDIVNDGAEVGSRNSSFVANALVSIAGYVNMGIPDSPVKSNPAQAREIYMQAATSFGDPEAQYRLGRLYLEGQGGPVDKHQAGRWFNLAANKGHACARAMLGQMMFEEGWRVKGLGMMTVALQTAGPADRGWIRQLQEEAFALASEDERRNGTELGKQMLAQK